MTTFADQGAISRKKTWREVERVTVSAPCAPWAWLESGNGAIADLTSGQPVLYSGGDGKKFSVALYMPGFTTRSEGAQSLRWLIETARLELTGGGVGLPANKPSVKLYKAGTEIASATDSPANFAAYSARHFVTMIPGDEHMIAPRMMLSFVVTDSSGAGAFSNIYWAVHVTAALVTEME